MAHLFSLSIYESSTLSKPYGINQRCYWVCLEEQFWNLRNTLRAHWEQGFLKKSLPFLPPPLKEKIGPLMSACVPFHWLHETFISITMGHSGHYISQNVHPLQKKNSMQKGSHHLFVVPTLDLGFIWEIGNGGFFFLVCSQFVPMTFSRGSSSVRPRCSQYHLGQRGRHTIFPWNFLFWGTSIVSTYFLLQWANQIGSLPK
jgi:hypothetical protein